MSSDLGYLGFGGYGVEKPDAFTNAAAGNKMYGFAGRSNPTSGPVAQEGYQERDMIARARKRAILNRMSAEQRGRYMDPDYLRSI